MGLSVSLWHVAEWLRCVNMVSEYLTVVGLGNPGLRYDMTRHNIGFAIVDALRACSGHQDLGELEGAVRACASDALRGALGQTGWQMKSGYLESTGRFGEASFHLIKPVTFMNRSGEPLQQFLAFRKIPVSQIVVVHDEIDIPFGTLKVKADGGEGGHNGLRSISEQCGGRGYARVRAGVGKPGPTSPLAGQADGIATWVLGKFTGEESAVAQELVVKGAVAVALLTTKGLRVAQNRFN